MSNPYAPPENRPRESAPSDAGPDSASASGPDRPDRNPAGVPYERPRGPIAESTPTHPNDVRRLAVLVRTTTLLVLLSLLADLLPFPWYVAAAALAVAGLVVGVLALTVAARTHQRAPRAAVILLVVLAIIGLARPGAALLSWDAESQYAHCQSGALTLQAQNACVSDYQRALNDRAAALTHRTP